MSFPRLLLRLALGRRLPITSGELRVPAISAPVTIRRDRRGVPHIEAANEVDATFALGFCQGQDRAGQLEILHRVSSGRLAEWVGSEALPVDRMSRRIGFRRAAERQVPALSAEAFALIDAFARGVTAGNSTGLSQKPHEFAVLGGEPSPWEAANVLAILKLQSFLLPSNWDVELARLRVLRGDGPSALMAVDPISEEGERGRGGDRKVGETGRQGDKETKSTDSVSLSTWLPVSLSWLAADLAVLQQYVPRGGGSNNWVIGGGRTASGKPLVASDPHLAPNAPAPWYLAHITTPDFSAAGAGMPGAPGIPIGHNGFAAWGVTAGLTDNSDLFLETLGPDGASVREADGTLSRCERVREVIKVKGKPDVVEDVLITPRGPVVTPLFTDLPPPPHRGPLTVHPEIVDGRVEMPEAAEPSPAAAAPVEAISLKAVWLEPLPIWGFLGVLRARSFEDFRRCFADWPLLPLNVVYGDAGGTIGYQLVGQIPKRRLGHGLLPMPADLPGAGWEPDLVPFEAMPTLTNPETGFIATANGVPPGNRGQEAGEREQGNVLLGLDFIDEYRGETIRDEIRKREAWDAAACGELQMNTRSMPWEQMRAIVLSLTPGDSGAREALALLRAWDGHVSAESPAAAIFELFVAEMCVRSVRAKAPNGWKAALGDAGLGATGHNLFADRRFSHLVRLLREQPEGWFPRGWPEEMADVLGGIIRRLRREVGPGPAYWAWGHLRRMRLEHPLFGKHRLLGPAFNLGPAPCGGDQNTISQAAARPLHPTDFTHNLANLRCVFDLANPAASRFVMAGGQSGNPCSPHFDDQFPLWQSGGAIPIPFEPAQVVRQTTAVLRLLPAGRVGLSRPG
jgi:penicillin amidase